MGKATGVFLILAGVGTAALVLPAVDKDAERQLAEVVGIATRGVQQPAPVASAPAKAPSQAVTAASSAAPQPAPVAPPVAPSKTQIAGADSIIPPVLIAPPQMVVRNSTTAPARGNDTEARADLARDIQRELKRVGCYEGELTGEWSSSTRRAMKSFIERVNAALPIDEPDHILRTMVQGHPGAACGKGCPTGQSAASDGRCLPAQINAQKLAPRGEAAIETAALAKATVPKPAPQPQPEANKVVARPATPKAAWETTVAAVPQQPLRGSESRMAVGGPTQVAPMETGSISNSSSSGPRTPRAATETSATTSGNDVVLPGAIAALATGAAAVALAPKADARGPREAVEKPASKRVLAPEPIESLSSKEKEQPKAERKLEAKPEPAARPRPQQQTARRATGAYGYPLPYFVGVQVPKVFYGGSKPERSNFNVRIYEKFARELR